MASVKLTYDFITPPDNNLVCSICLEVAKNPKQCEDCGKLFCSECIEKNGNKPCPNCRAKDPKYFKDKRGEREIKDLRVRCASKKRGCPWTGTIGTLDTHLATCEFALVLCPNKCEGDKDTGEIQLMRKDLDNHLKTKCLKRRFECQHCGEKGTYASITGDHNKVCEKKIVACPNKGSGCQLSVERGKTKQHVSICKYTEVACAYESLGCGVRMLRKDIKIHETGENESHLHLVLGVVKPHEEQLKKMSEENKTLSEQYQSLSEEVRLLSEQQKTLSEGETFVFKLPGYASKKEKKEIFYSAPFYTHSGGYKMCIKVHANGFGDGADTHVSVFTKILQGRYDDQLKWPFLGTVTYELLNQLTDDRHYSRVVILDSIANMQVGSSRGYNKFLPHSSLCHDPATNTQYLLDDALYFRLSVKVDNHKPWLVCTDKINVDSIRTINKYRTLKNEEEFVFKVTEYSALKATKSTFYSNSFYTSPGGYSIRIRIAPNGLDSGVNTHVSVSAKLIEGSYDASLSWPFLGTVTFTLLNQLSDDNHYTKTLEFKPINNRIVGDSWGYHTFISQSALSHDPVKNTQYLKNDTLYFRVSVKDNTHKSWLTCTHNN